MKKAFRIAGITLLSMIGMVLIGLGILVISSAEKFDQNKKIVSEQAIENQPFEGVFFSSTRKDKAVIVVSGSDGGIAYAKK